jgi:ABC-type Mn2+/Zn2+ transport system ATPase subunit
MDPCEIGFRQAVFSWSNVSDGTLTPSRQQFSLRIEDELLFKPGRINLIVGPTASGKTSLLMALLGEMHYIPLGPNSSVNLPRSGGVAYAAQESWVQNETIRVKSHSIGSSTSVLISFDRKTSFLDRNSMKNAIRKVYFILHHYSLAV